MARARAALATDDDRDVFDEWMAQPVGMKGRRSDRQIAQDLSAELVEDFGEWQVGTHRRQECRCFRGIPK